MVVQQKGSRRLLTIPFFIILGTVAMMAGATPAFAQPSGNAAPPTQDVAAPSKKVSNAFQDSDLKQALSDLGLAAGVSVVADETVQGNVTASIKNKTIEQALDILLLPGGYCWAKIGDAYLVG